MANKMLIDATHPEETRVVVTRGNRIEEFDFEAASKKQLRGNIYLARVTRVEPSLQAAFVDYGGNRHGFLAFSEIHPDYYQIPFADRQALIDEESEDHAREDDDGNGDSDDDASAAAAASDDSLSEDAYDGEGDSDNDGEDGDDRPAEIVEVSEDDNVESVGSEDALEELPRRAPRRRRSYKIQEVIKRKQVLLVQVVKEERGNKGAALTTYLSLAGRYSVLMPNTARGGGISRKITSASDRKRLKEVARELEVPQGMGVILRTAGASRTKPEIRRDFEYLMRMWENVRELTLESMAPTLVYEEGNLVKRAIRDLYNKDIDQIQVSGEAAYREAKDFMRMLMPSHAKNVQLYKEDEPIFIRNQVENQLDAMFSAEVTLKSGGYIVINQTEALVAIDVNSGKATREHSIEDTALKTNMEAAAEISRQLRLRDLAGLIVIDFIDMEEKRNNRSVERKLKECLKSDRARIQVGRISHFGLMEMSRQRIRSGIMEGSFEQCAHCAGSGIVRSTASVALHALRAIEDELRKRAADLNVTTRAEAALYILNQKRDHLFELEQRFGVRISVLGDDSLVNTLMTMERHAPSRQESRAEARVVTTDGAPIAEAESEDEDTNQSSDGSGRRRRRRRRRRGGEDDNAQNEEVSASNADESDDEDDDENESDNASQASDDSDDNGEEREGGRRRRRRGRRGGRRRRGQNADNNENADAQAQDGDAQSDQNSQHDSGSAVSDGETPDEVDDAAQPSDNEQAAAADGEEKKKPSRRGRGRGRKKDAEDATPASDGEAAVEAAEATESDGTAPAAEEEAPKPKRRSRRSKKAVEEETVSAEAVSEEPAIDDAPSPAPESEEEPVAAQAAEEPVAADAPNGHAEEPASEAEPAVDQPAEDEPSQPVRKGWWQRALRGGSE
ncbi:Rne/Rng family ribonuclease [Tepidamorphus sp. 3E244]|uniref:Rne/Rng family ribonuclease n=1 Tax=Tepidamorphus sp. 3E244 TaxID=3385498 RepID=UPI0038FC5CA7